MKNYIILISLFILTSCNWAKEKTINTVNKTGELVAEGGSEFVEGFKKGIEKNIQGQIVVSENLKSKGISTSKITYTETDSSTLISIYFIFDQDFEGGISAKLFDKENMEYGRTFTKQIAKKGEAFYIEFNFDKKTQIEKNGKLLLDFLIG